jgi:gliding motility-associated-like protein
MKFLRYTALLLILSTGIPGLSQITFIADTTIGCNSLEVTFTYINASVIDTVTSVDWDFGNGQTASGKEQQTVTYDAPGSYTVSILINNNTTITRLDYIKIYPNPDATFFWSDSLELGSYTVVYVNVPQELDTIPYTYQWLLEDGGTGDARVLIHSFPAEGMYRSALIVSNPVGCADSSMRLVEVTDVLDCPNVFSPNDDGINDYFIISSNGVSVYNFQVFSRSGIRVYQAEAPLIMWDGRNQSGQELLPGTYFYIIKPVQGTGRFEKTGFIELYR